MAKRYDFGTEAERVFIGTNITLRVQVVKRDSAGVEIVDGDLTGRTYTFTLNNTPDNTTPLLTKTVGAGITFVDGDTAGYPPELAGTKTVCKIDIADTETDALADGAYYFDLKRTNAGAETVVAFGTITLTKGITA
jgi:hypothetical protein